MVGSLGAGVGLWESATVRFSHTGTVQVMTGTHSHGQGHETTFAQLIAEKLGVPIDNVDVIHGDTEKTPVGMGTYGSRSLAVGGQAIVNAAEKIIAKGKKIAAHLLEASEADIEFKDGQFTVAGTDRARSIGEVVFAAYVPHNYPPDLEPGLEETAFYDPANFTFPAGAYVCEVEVDPQTGVVAIDRFVAVDDFGKLVNPMIVEGQVHGGLAQGIGQALVENCVYDESGQLVSGSFMDYCMPKADNVPSFQVEHHRDAVHPQHARRQRLRRGGRDRRAAGGHERGHRCDRRAHLDAGNARESLARAAGQEPAAGGRIGRPFRCMHSSIIVRPASRMPSPCSRDRATAC